MAAIVEARNVSRFFQTRQGVKRAVQDISLDIQPGTIFGMLGPNGAGKSTTIKMMTTLLLPSSGLLRVLGHDVTREEGRIRPHIGFLYGGETGLYWQLNGRDNLRFFGSLFKLEKSVLERRIDEWLERLNLQGDAHRLTMHYSKGMKQRLHIARALLHNPDLVFMDEPTLGLDPQGTSDLRVIIQSLKEAGKTIILTTHDMEEAQELCDEIAFIMDGTIVTQGRFEELQDRFQDFHEYQVELAAWPDGPLNLAVGELIRPDLRSEASTWTLRIPKSPAGDAAFSEWISHAAKFGIRNVSRRQMDLRSIYLQIAQGNAVVHSVGV